MKILNLCYALGVTALALTGSLKADTILATDAMWTVTGGTSNLTTGVSYKAAFGYSSDSLYSYNTYWAPGSGAVPSYLNISTTIDLSGYDLPTVQYSFAIDNDATIYVNGMQIAHLIHEGAASWTSFATLTNATSGLNQIDVVAVDRGGASFFDLTVRGTQHVPDAGSTLIMLGASLLGLVGLRRRLLRI